jgi:hypothetical protein
MKSLYKSYGFVVDVVDKEGGAKRIVRIFVKAQAG